MKCREQNCFNETNWSSGLCDEHIGNSADGKIPVGTEAIEQPIDNYAGMRVQFAVNNDEECKHCRGGGDANWLNTAGYMQCFYCNGTGKKQYELKLVEKYAN